jgi:hypothetical protein
MPSDRPGGDWRHPQAGGKPAPKRATNNGNTSRRAWQPGGPQAAAETGRARSRGTRLLVAGVATAALVTLLVFVIRWLWPARYPDLVLVGATSGESFALPENQAGVNIAAALAGWTGEGSHRDRPKIETHPVVTVTESGPKISIDPNAKNLVVYLAAHGGADANGPYLWMAPPDARSAAEAHKVRVGDILARVAESRRGKATLLIFDSTRVATSWAHGILFNDFARALKELDSRIEEIPGLAVICASDDDQRSWLFEERRVSAFGHFLLEAMRGAGHDKGQRVTAASAFKQTKEDVERWSIASRGEKQTPILLPQASGESRAEKIDLAAAPAGGYQSPPKIDPPANVPPELEDAWKKANDLAAQVPPPEANNPAKWREYLELLMRYERLFRLGVNTDGVRLRVAALASELENPSIGREPACLPTAIPTARALGRRSPFPDKNASEQFRSAFLSKVWRGITKDDRKKSWDALLLGYPGQETLIRTAAADLVITQVTGDPSDKNLALAEEVLALTHGGLPAPAEAHFVRMLHLHLDKDTRPGAGLLKDALALRKEAEEAAWVFAAQAKEYPYAEEVYAWVSGHIEAGDRSRQRGQDLLFGIDQKMYDQAGEHFKTARAAYAKAHADGRKVAAALAVRDKVFARLPYYARWLAAYRGSRPPVQIDELLDRAEKAANRAHDIAEMTTRDPLPVDQLDKLDALRSEADGHFKAIADAFDADVAGLGNTEQPSNWHALDSALGVPFIQARRRAELLGALRHVSYQLQIQQQQPGGSQVPPPPARQVAVRNGRVALAILRDTSPDRRHLLERADREGWNSVRALGDQIGELYRGLANEARQKANESVNKPTLKAGRAPLADAAIRGRLADPAAPLVGLDPVAADQRSRRHSFLLWQAQRVTVEGWDDVPNKDPKPYCSKVAGLLIASGESLIRENAAELTGRPSENMSPGELDRWLADCRAEAGRKPVQLTLDAAPAHELAEDEPSWEFAFTLRADARDKELLGFPVSWLEAPKPPHPQAQPGDLARRVVPDFIQGRTEATRPVRFARADSPREASGLGHLTSNVLYRGHVYRKVTAVQLVGTPTRELVYTPPKGPACFAVRADGSAVAGAVTILIDLTDSMNEPLDPDNKNSKSRLAEAKDGLKLVLQQLPDDTRVTLAYFYGTDRKTPRLMIGAYDKPLKKDGDNLERLYNLIKNEKAPGLSTPVAGAIQEVLEKDNAKKFWPEDYTGSRTLIVLTDGEDNWGRLPNRPSAYPNQEEPGLVALKALQNTPDDVNLHIVYFGLTSKAGQAEEDAAVEQFKILRDPVHFSKSRRTPAQLWTKIHDARALAKLVKGAMLPHFQYSDGKRLTDRLEATVPEEIVQRTTPGLGHEVYQFFGLRNPQSLQLRPGGRVMLDAKRNNNGKFDLSLPAYAMEVARKERLPRNTTGTAQSGIHGTLPMLTRKADSFHHNLSAVMTLEPVDERHPNELEAPRPQFVWFDVAYADGKPAYKGLTPGLRVENRSPFWAPAWNLNLVRWAPAGVEGEKVRHPLVTAFWLDGFPLPAASFSVNLDDLAGSWRELKKTFPVRDSEVTLRTISRERYEGPGLPPGQYLTVRLKYGRPGEMVYLRPGNFKGTDQPYQLHEQHVYYDEHALYTVRFGPLYDTDPHKTVTLQLHSVADIREESVRTKRSVAVQPPDGALRPITIPQPLEVGPRE